MTAIDPSRLAAQHVVTVCVLTAEGTSNQVDDQYCGVGHVSQRPAWAPEKSSGSLRSRRPSVSSRKDTLKSSCSAQQSKSSLWRTLAGSRSPTVAALRSGKHRWRHEGSMEERARRNIGSLNWIASADFDTKDETQAAAKKSLGVSNAKATQPHWKRRCFPCLFRSSSDLLTLGSRKACWP